MSASKKFDQMTQAEKTVYMAAGNVTVGTITTMIEGEPGKATFKKYYVGKVRGRIVGDVDNYKFASAVFARTNAMQMREEWRAEAAKIQAGEGTS